MGNYGGRVVTEKPDSDQLEKDMLGQRETTHRGFLAKAAELGFSEEEIENLHSIYGATERRDGK